jgi:hypothetical protein
VVRSPWCGRNVQRRVAGRGASLGFKLIPVSLLPFGRDIVSIDQARAAGLTPDVAVPANPTLRR